MLYVQDPNVNLQICSSNGKNFTSISQELLKVVGGRHFTVPSYRTSAFVFICISYVPSALENKNWQFLLTALKNLGFFCVSLLIYWSLIDLLISINLYWFIEFILVCVKAFAWFSKNFTLSLFSVHQLFYKNKMMSKQTYKIPYLLNST